MTGMPYSIIRVSLKLPSQHVAEMREILENAVDQAAIRNIPVSDISVDDDECADPPVDPGDDV